MPPQTAFLCPERGENMDLSEIMKMSQEAIAGAAQLKASCERG